MRGNAWLSGVVLLAVSVAARGVPAATDTDWPTYGHDPGGMRYSPLTQINTSNVAQLKSAWTYSMRVTGTEAPASEDAARRVSEGATPFPRRRSRLGASQTTPLVIDGTMYLSTPYRRVVALDAQSGSEVWHYDVPGPGQPSLRGVEYWPGDTSSGPRIVFGTRDGRLIALDAKTGLPADEFGAHGIVDLKTPDIVPEVSTSPMAQYGLTSPPLVYRNLIVTGSAVQEFPALGASGDVRAWDAHTGKLVWTFHTVPRPGEYAHDTWAMTAGANDPASTSGVS